MQQIKSLWKCSTQHLAWLIGLSFILQSISFFVFPGLWIKSDIKSVYIQNPVVQMNGRSNMLIVKSSNNKYRSWTVNCSYSNKDIKNICAKLSAHQFLKVKSLTLISLERTHFKSKAKITSAFIQQLQLSNSIINHHQISIHSHQNDFNQWMRYQNMPTFILRLLCILNLIYVSVVIFKRQRDRSSAKSSLK